MSLSKFDIVWNVMLRYSFYGDSTSVADKLTCSLCMKLLIDAYQSICGCQYCHHCLEEYLKWGPRVCPGEKTECNKETLVRGQNVFRDLITSSKICNLRVKCPNESCHSSVELTYMDEHLRVCTKLPVECPFLDIGCCTDRCTKDLVQSHLQDEALSHYQMLFQWIYGLQNEIYSVKEALGMRALEIQSLQEDSRMKEDKILMLEANIDEKDNALTLLRNEVNEIKNISQNAARQEYDVGYDNAKSSGDLKTLIDDLSNDLIALKLERKKNEDRERRMMYWIKWNKLCPNIDVDFIWKIDDCVLKRDTFIYSDSFYTKNYKFFLHFCLYGNKDIKLGCYIMRGDRDYVLQWPMCKVITLSIVDQETFTPYKSSSFTYNSYSNKKAFNKPITDSNEYIGDAIFMSLSSIKDQASIVVNDSIVVSFSLND